MRTYRKLRQIINDTRHNSVVFYNEIFADTRIARLPGETVAKRDWRALCSMANWYNRHLGKPIVLLSEVFHQTDLDPSSSHDNLVSVRTMKQYIDQYWPDHSLLQSLVQVLAEAVLEDDLERIKMSSNKNKSEPAVSGYTEVRFALSFSPQYHHHVIEYSVLVQSYGRIRSRH